MSDALRKLLERYANGRPLCNCGHAWAARPGERHLSWDGTYLTTRGGECLWGCQNAQYRAAMEVAEAVVKEFNI